MESTVKESPLMSSTEPTPPAPPTSPPCASCGAPLHEDQRYCVNCGARRPETRLEFLDVLDADARERQVVATTVTTTEPAGVNGRLQANAGLLALGAIVLVALLIGLLVGHWATTAGTTKTVPAAAAPAQVITVQGGGAAADATTTAPQDTGTTTGTTTSKPKSTKKSNATTTTATTPKDSVSVNTLNDKKSLDNAVKKGKPISTGTGKLPPTDDKPAGGGSGFEDIG
jgi:hypothetical protein